MMGHIDLALILVSCTAITAVAWAYEVFFLAPKRAHTLAQLPDTATTIERERASRIPSWVDFLKSLFPIFLAVLLLRSFLAEPFRIPSGSMMPTLLVGDFILVNKFAYGIRLPVLNNKIIAVGAPSRGDVVVFRYPKNPTIPYIKRVVGLPGDTVQYDAKEKILYINGQRVSNEAIGVYQINGSGTAMTGYNEQKENLLGMEHHILINPREARSGPVEDLVVPEGHYFVLGDNRDNSQDGRYWGTVPDENLIGKAFFIWMNWDWKMPGWISWSRIFMSIQ